MNRIASCTLAFALLTTAPLAAQTQPRPPVFTTQIRELSFPNGMRAVLARTPAIPGRAPRAFVGLYLRYGTATAGRPELAHLVEHIAANNLPTTIDYTLPTGLPSFGGNAMTRPDYMSFWRTVPPEALDAIVPNRANRVAGIRDDSAIFAREAGRVASETERTIARIDKQGLTASDILPAAFFGDRVPLTALLDTIRSFTRLTVFAQIQQYIRPGNAVLVVAGDIDLDSTATLVGTRLGAYPARSGPPSSRGPAPIAYRTPLVVRDERAIVAHVGLGLAVSARTSPDFVAFMVLDQFLLGGRQLVSDTAEVVRSADSPLARRLAEKLGATNLSDGRDYGTGPPLLAFASPTFAAAYFDAPRPIPADSIAAGARHALAAALTIDLTDAAVTTAKRQLVEFLDRWMLGPDLLHLGDHLAAFALIDGSATRLNHIPQEINAVTPDRVRRLAKGFLTAGGARIAIVAPPSR